MSQIQDILWIFDLGEVLLGGCFLIVNITRMEKLSEECWLNYYVINF